MRIEQLHTKQFVKTLGPLEQQIIQRLYQEIKERKDNGKSTQDQINAILNRTRLLEEKTSNIDNKLKSLLAIDFRDFLTREEHLGSGGNAHALATPDIAGFMSAVDKTFLDNLRESGTSHFHENLNILDKIQYSGTLESIDLIELEKAHEHSNKNILDKIKETVDNNEYDISTLHKHSNISLLEKLFESIPRDSYDLSAIGSSHNHDNMDVLRLITRTGNEVSYDLSQLSKVHSHSNKNILDKIRQTGTESELDLSRLSDVHTHTNIEILRRIASSISQSSYDLSQLHIHANKDVLDALDISESGNLMIHGIEQSLHSHSNKSILDKVVSSKSLAQYDVGLIHEHANMSTLQKFGTDAEGNLTFSGAPISGGGAGHNHTNLDVLEKVIQTGAEVMIDLSDITKSKQEISSLSGRVQILEEKPDYVHPESHPASMIAVEDVEDKFADKSVQAVIFTLLQRIEVLEAEVESLKNPPASP